MSGGVRTFIAASRARHDVVCVEGALAVRQIGKEEYRRLALVAGDNDVPRPRFGRKHGGKPPVCRG
jgi:hypothetical protein